LSEFLAGEHFPKTELTGVKVELIVPLKK